MCLAKRRTKRDYMPLSVKECLCLQILDSMSGCIRHRCLLVSQPEWQNGGTVEPPCDFQSGLSEMSVFIGIPP